MKKFSLSRKSAIFLATTSLVGLLFEIFSPKIDVLDSLLFALLSVLWIKKAYEGDEWFSLTIGLNKDGE